MENILILHTNKYNIRFYIFCLIHASLWILLPLLTRYNVPFDTIEGIVWGREWQLGYDKHPFLAAWLSHLATWLGHSVGWPTYLLAQIMMVLTFYSIWRLAQHLVTPPQALICVLLLEGIWYYNWLTPKFNPTTLMTSMWAVTIYVYYLAIEKEKFIYWISTGFLAALCMLSKYQSALLIFPMGIIALVPGKSIHQYSKKLLSACAVFIITLLPHLYWLTKHQFIPFRYAYLSTTRESQQLIDSSWLTHIWNPIDFLLEQLGALILVGILFLLIIIFCKKGKQSLYPYQKRFILILGLSPLLLTMTMTFVTGMYLYANWGTPYLILTGILLIAFYNPKISDLFLKWFYVLLLFLTIVTALLRALYLIYSPIYFKNTESDAYFPGKPIAEHITELWHKRFKRPLEYVVGNHYLIANIAAYSKDMPTPFFNYDLKQSPWINVDSFKRKGGVWLWYSGSNLSEQRRYQEILKNEYSNFIDIGVLSFPKFIKYSNQSVKIYVILIPPAD